GRSWSKDRAMTGENLPDASLVGVAKRRRGPQQPTPPRLRERSVPDPCRRPRAGGPGAAQHSGWIADLSRAAMGSLIGGALLGAIGWRFCDVAPACPLADFSRFQAASRSAIDSIADRIVTAESHGDGSAKNELSSATGSGQFLDATWLDMIRTARPDLAAVSET